MKTISGIEVADYSFDAPDDATKPIEEKFDFKADTEVIGDKIYINPLLFLTKSKNPFASDVRLLPVYYGFPQMEKNNITIEIPDGYAVVSIPQPVSVQMPENVGTFTMNIQQQNKIQLTSTSEVKMAVVASDFYQNLKSFYARMVEAQNEK